MLLGQMSLKSDYMGTKKEYAESITRKEPIPFQMWSVEVKVSCLGDA